MEMKREITELNRIKVKIVNDPAYEPTLHLSFNGVVPIDPELWVNPSIANDPNTLLKHLDWAEAHLKSVLQRSEESVDNQRD
jgi:hypothetical protein